MNLTALISIAPPISAVQSGTGNGRQTLAKQETKMVGTWGFGFAIAVLAQVMSVLLELKMDAIAD